MNEKLNYLKQSEQKDQSFSIKQNIYETNELMNIIYKKWEEEKVRQGSYVGNPKRYIPVTNLYGCGRMLTYNRLGYTPDINIIKRYPHTVLINGVGQYVHDYIAKLLGIYNTTKIYLEDDNYKVRGKCDGILYNALIEIKTVEELPANVEDMHVLQARLLFQLAFNKQYKQLNLVKVLYVKRNFKQFKEYNIHIHLDENIEITKPYFEKGKKLYDCVINKQLSPDVNTKDCFFCGYQTICEYSSMKKQSVKPQVVQQKPVNNNTIQDENQKTEVLGREVIGEQNKREGIEWII